jgi:PIN domain nuclease of toxin-antitoxin system
LKWQAGKLSLPGPPRSWIEEQRATWDLTRAPLELEHLYRSTELPSHHRDPFDRLLVAQSIVEGLTLVTPDPAIRAYPVSVLW